MKSELLLAACHLLLVPAVFSQDTSTIIISPHFARWFVSAGKTPTCDPGHHRFRS